MTTKTRRRRARIDDLSRHLGWLRARGGPDAMAAYWRAWEDFWIEDGE